MDNYDDSAEAYLSFLYQYHPDAVVMVASKETIERTLNGVAITHAKNYKWILLTGDSVLPRLNHTFFQDESILFISAKSRTYGMHSFKIQMTTKFNKGLGHSFLLIYSTVPYKYQLLSVKSYDKRNKWVNQGVWSQQTGLRLVSDKMFANQFEDFGYATLKIATLPVKPFIFTERDSKNNTIYSGFCMEILNELAFRFKFKYELVEPPDHQFGSRKEDGTWTGMVGMTQRKDVEFAVGPFTITSARDEVIDFTTTYLEVANGILTRRPHSESNKEYKVFKPLTVEVWGLIGAAIVSVGALLYAVNKLSLYYNVQTQGDSLENQLDLQTSIWLMYGTFFELDVPEFRPRSWSGRAMLGLWWIFTILMLAAYTAQLAAYLTVSIIEPPINSLEELADQDAIKPLFLEGTNLQDLFRTENSPTYKKIFDKTSGMPYVITDSEALNYVKSGQYALIHADIVLEYLQNEDCTTYVLAKEKFNHAGLGFIVQEKANYLEAFNLAIMKMAEGGLIERWRKKWLLQGNSCETTNVVGSANSLDMDSLLGLFYVYIGAIGISTFVFVIEVIWKTKRMGRVKNKVADKIGIVTTSLRNRQVVTPDVVDT